MKTSTIKVRIDLSSGAWIAATKKDNEPIIYCGEGREDNFVEAEILEAIYKLEEAILE